jgi:hypothetical protein
MSEKSIADVLDAFISEPHGEEITLAEIVGRLGDRAYGLAILLFALPNTIPVGIPGISSICAVPIMLFALQLMLGRQRLWMPRWLASRSVPALAFNNMIRSTLPRLRKIERYIKPRMDMFTSDMFEKKVGFMVFILAAIIFLPIPLGNFIPAICMCIMAMGLLSKDGGFVIAGIIAGILTTIGMSFVIIAFFEHVVFEAIRWIGS